MHHFLIATSACAILAMGTATVAAQPRRAPIRQACALGYSLNEVGRCTSSSPGFGVDAYPLGYSVGPFANFAPLYGRPYRVVARDGISEYVAGE